MKKKFKILIFAFLILTSFINFFSTSHALAPNCYDLFDQIKNNRDAYYNKRMKKLNSVNWRSKLNYFSFHLSNPILTSFRNSILKALIKNDKFLDSYLGEIYRG